MQNLPRLGSPARQQRGFFFFAGRRLRCSPPKSRLRPAGGSRKSPRPFEAARTYLFLLSKLSLARTTRMKPALASASVRIVLTAIPKSS